MTCLEINNHLQYYEYNEQQKVGGGGEVGVASGVLPKLQAIPTITINTASHIKGLNTFIFIFTPNINQRCEPSHKIINIVQAQTCWFFYFHIRRADYT